MKLVKFLCLFSLALLSLTACKKNDKDSDTDPEIDPNRSALYFYAKINGKAFLIEDLKEGYGSGAGASGSGQSGEPGTEIQEMLLLHGSLTKGASVSFVKNFTSKPSACSGIEAMFRMGSYAYGRVDGGNNNTPLDGVVIGYTDATGKTWSSDFGTANQSGSTFEIIEHIANPDGFSQRISKAKFACKLYDGQGNMQTLTDGEIRSRSVQCGHL